MRELDEYLQGDFQSVSREIAEIEHHLARLARTYARAPWDDQRRTCWSYEIRPGGDPLNGGFSITTTATVVSALDALFGEAPRTRASSSYRQHGEFSAPRLGLEPGEAACLRERRDFARAELGVRLKREDEAPGAFLERLDLPDRGRGAVATLRQHPARILSLSWSGTFGADDPLTAGWLFDALCRPPAGGGGMDGRPPPVGGDRNNNAPPPGAEGAGYGLSRRLVALVHERLNGWSRSRRIADCLEPPRATPGDSSYLLVRFARFLSALESSDPTLSAAPHARETLLAHFEARLHEQLSLAEIPLSRFDPSELAYALEGLLLLSRHAVDEQVFERVFAVMARAQEADVSWRAETPILYEAAGKVLFPVSVETASALLSSLMLFDGHGDQAGHERFHDARGSRYIGLLMRYWKWLRARMVVVRTRGQELIGWHSEHVDDPELIHAWETAQVLEFLLALRHQAKRVVAREALILSRLSRKSAVVTGETPQAYWAALAARVEPVRCLGPGLEIYRRIGEDFVAGHQRAGHECIGPTRPGPGDGGPEQGASTAWSMLLYGPPGTGKTTVAEKLATALGWPLITVSVGDFLAAGSALIEARVKNLFEVLKVQPRSVVLFDEIDQFLLDRDSQYFREQDTVFQFLTPGMLTKLNDLRQAEAVIFILATNYAERIDAAIKRSGRIDCQYLLLPMDGDRRLEALGWVDDQGSLADSGPAAQARRHSVFLGFSDLKSVRRRADGGGSLAALLQETSPPVHPGTYGSRFLTREQVQLPADKVPIEEFLALLLLAVDARAPSVPAGSRVDPTLIAELRAEYREVLACVRAGAAARPELITAILRRWRRPELGTLALELLNG